MNRRKITTEKTYHNYPILADKQKNMACDTKILDEIERQLEYAEKVKNKTYVMRMDVRFPDDKTPTDNKVFSNFQKKVILQCKRQGYDPQYVAVAEMSSNGKLHYHLALLLDAEKTHNAQPLMETAERLLASTLGLDPKVNHGLVNDCTKGRNGETYPSGMVLTPGSPDYEVDKGKCFQRLSYLAKVHSKADGKTGKREIFSSRIPKDETEDGNEVTDCDKK